ncbi:DUF4255 domain-containing protein [Shewanella surugensis]|uniref:DUF4255 domain-containing protein n=1 Tax=Shewanella surugensis TaxID=212020 RepID=A0ABT0L7S9_9GAMM|nr:DUF4255 domain-containing protein [Shewanella surugensis]MCL1123751.1 DUF4255 domain-containing protein [Shewanella surugensis]
MILSCVNFIALQLNQYIKNTFDINEDIVIISNLVEQDGSIIPQVNNKLVLCVVNLEKETSVQGRNHHKSSISATSLSKALPIHFNVYLLVCANFNGDNYPESLKFISTAVAFFQQRNMFNHQNSPELSAGIDKLILDIENVKSQEMCSLWNMIGAKYMPSILYKIRLVSIDPDSPESRETRISKPDYSIHQQAN